MLSSCLESIVYTLSHVLSMSIVPALLEGFSIVECFITHKHCQESDWDGRQFATVLPMRYICHCITYTGVPNTIRWSLPLFWRQTMRQTPVFPRHGAKRRTFYQCLRNKLKPYINFERRLASSVCEYQKICSCGLTQYSPFTIAHTVTLSA